MARKVNGQTYREWRDKFLADNSMTLPLDLATKRTTLFLACPHGFFPSLDAQRWSTFVSMDSGADKRDGLVYMADADTGKPVVDAYIQLELDDFRAACVRRAALAFVDVEYIREMAHAWAAQHPGQIVDVDAFVDDVKRAAGL